MYYTTQWLSLSSKEKLFVIIGIIIIIPILILLDYLFKRIKKKISKCNKGEQRKWKN